MNRDNRGIIIGMVLGDGCLRSYRNKQGKNINQLLLKHGQNQKEYIEHKADLVHSIFGGRKTKVIKINNNGYVGYINIKNNAYFGNLHSWIYAEGKKTYSRNILNMLTPHGIAIWYMDDGSLYAKRRNGKIHAYELILSTYVSKEQNQIIIDYFKETFSLEFTMVKSKGSYRLRMGTKEARKFVELVKPYIVPTMLYKIDFAKN